LSSTPATYFSLLPAPPHPRMALWCGKGGTSSALYHISNKGNDTMNVETMPQKAGGRNITLFPSYTSHAQTHTHTHTHTYTHKCTHTHPAHRNDLTITSQNQLGENPFQPMGDIECGICKALGVLHLMSWARHSTPCLSIAHQCQGNRIRTCRAPALQRQRIVCSFPTPLPSAFDGLLCK